MESTTTSVQVQASARFEEAGGAYGVNSVQGPVRKRDGAEACRRRLGQLLLLQRLKAPHFLKRFRAPAGVPSTSGPHRRQALHRGLSAIGRRPTGTASST